MLPPVDLAYLATSHLAHTVSVMGGMTCVVIPGLPVPGGFTVPAADLLIRLSPGYPDVPPDMWWFNPPVRRTDGAEIQATQCYEHILGREWQRWSRHLSPGQWRSGVDCLESYLAIVRRELVAAAPKVGA